MSKSVFEPAWKTCGVCKGKGVYKTGKQTRKCTTCDGKGIIQR